MFIYFNIIIDIDYIPINNISQITMFISVLFNEVALKYIIQICPQNVNMFYSLQY